MKTIIFIVLILVVASGQSQVVRPYSAPILKKLSSPYTGDFYSTPTLHYNVSTNQFTNNSYDITSDIYGRIWTTGGNSGFHVFDGEYEYNFGSQNSFFDRITTVRADVKGRIWIGGNGLGVYCLSAPMAYKLYVNSPIFPVDTLNYDISDVHIRAIECDSKGNAWVGTAKNGISYITDDTTYIWGVSNQKLEKESINSLAVDKNDIVWFINANKLYYIKDLKLTEYKHDSKLGRPLSVSGNGFSFVVVTFQSSNNHFAISENTCNPLIANDSDLNLVKNAKAQNGPKGELFLHTNSKIFQLKNGYLQEIFDNYESFAIHKICIDKTGRIWIGSSNDGIYLLPELGISRLPKFNLYRNNRNHFLVQDDKNEVYEIVIDSLHNKTVWKQFDLEKDEKLLDALITKQGTHYKTSTRNLFVDFETHTAQKETNPFFIESTETLVFQECYIGIQKDNFSILDSSGDLHVYNYSITSNYKPFFKRNKEIFFLDLSNNINANIIKFNENTCDTIYSNIGGDSLRVTTAMYLNDSTFYIGTWGLYLMRICNDSISFHPEGLGTNILIVFNADKSNNGWFSGIEGGINYVDYKTGIAVNYSIKDGFPGAKGAIYRAHNSNDMIAATRSGITWFKTLKPELPVHSKEDFYEKYEIINFTNEDGLLGENYSHAQLTSDGALIVTNNLRFPQIFFPEQLNTRAPVNLHFKKIAVEDINRNNRIVFQWYPGVVYKPIQTLQINYTENLTVDVSSIYFDDHFTQTYAYCVDSSAWSEPNNSSHFRIAGLSSGTHKLSFISYSKNGSSSEPIHLEITIIGPVYEKIWFWLIIIIALFIMIYIVFRWRTIIIRQRARELENTVEERTAEIKLQKIELETQHEEIKDSINYAKRLQDAILPSKETIDSFIRESFVYFNPKDVVSGDFYWFENINNISYIAVADCTGHGVPGALVSVVCSNALNRTINEFKITQPGKILDKTRELVIETFSKSSFNVKDGMDIALCAITDKEVIFSGANNPLWILRETSNLNEKELNAKNTLTLNDYSIFEIKGDKQPIGIHDAASAFNETRIEIMENDVFYLFSDGFPDQFGGETKNNVKPGGKKLKYKPFKQILLGLASSPVKNQGQALNTAFYDWKGSFEQVDDICIIGFKLK